MFELVHHILQGGGKLIKVKRIIMNPKNNPQTTDYDLSLLELDETLTYTDDIQRIELIAFNVAKIKDGTECLAGVIQRMQMKIRLIYLELLLFQLYINQYVNFNTEVDK